MRQSPPSQVERRALRLQARQYRPQWPGRQATPPAIGMRPPHNRPGDGTNGGAPVEAVRKMLGLQPKVDPVLARIGLTPDAVRRVITTVALKG